jgi:hypothetical protein
MSELEMGTVYDLNKQLVQKEEKALSNSKLREKKKTIISFAEKCKDIYFMLLCNERKDYTVFNLYTDWEYEQLETMANILVDECLKNRGEIRAIDITEDKGAIEIWLIIDGEAYCYYFFPYGQAVIEI